VDGRQLRASGIAASHCDLTLLSTARRRRRRCRRWRRAIAVACGVTGVMASSNKNEMQTFATPNEEGDQMYRSQVQFVEDTDGSGRSGALVHNSAGGGARHPLRLRCLLPLRYSCPL